MKNKPIVLKKFLSIIFLSSLFHYSFSQSWTLIGDYIHGGAADVWMQAVDLSDDGSRVAMNEQYNYYGRVRVFDNVNNNWVQVGQDILGDLGDQLGSALRMSSDGNTIVCGAPFNDSSGTQSGRVKVFSFDGSNWNQLGDNIEGSTDAQLGTAVDISADGSIIALGAPYQSNTNGIADTGQVFVYQWNGSDWIQMGQVIIGGADGDFFGIDLTLDAMGTTLAISGPANNNNTGHVRVYTWNGASWVMKGQEFTGSASSENFGTHIALAADGNILAIGSAYKTISAPNDGEVVVYEWNGSSWVLKGSPLQGTNGEWFGHSVDLSNDGNTLAVGAPWSDNGGLDAGANRVYLWDGTNWSMVGSEIVGTDIHNYCGSFDISLNGTGDHVAVIAYGNDSLYNDCGQARVFSSPYLSTAELKTSPSFSVYPNPASRKVAINSQKTIASVELYSIEGSVMDADYHFTANGATVDLGDLSVGLYTIRVLFDDGSMGAQRIVKSSQ